MSWIIFGALSRQERKRQKEQGASPKKIPTIEKIKEKISGEPVESVPQNFEKVKRIGNCVGEKGFLMRNR